MDGSRDLWLLLLSLALVGTGTVLWWFIQDFLSMRREMPEKYATKAELRDLSDDWKAELESMRVERRIDNENTQRKLDKIGDSVNGIHRRIDTLVDRAPR